VRSATPLQLYGGNDPRQKDAQKTNAYQETENLMLSPTTHAVPIPGLEILANDVRCHARGQRSAASTARSCSTPWHAAFARDAERLIVRGFFQDILDRIESRGRAESLAAAPSSHSQARASKNPPKSLLSARQRKAHTPSVPSGAAPRGGSLAATLDRPVGGAVVKGDERVLVVLATRAPSRTRSPKWSKSAAQARSFFSTASFGQVQLHVDVNSVARRFNGNPAAEAARTAARRTSSRRRGSPPTRPASTRPPTTTSSTRIADSHCGFHGVTWGTK